MQPGQRRGRSPDRPALVALALGLAGLTYRLVLVLRTVPGANSDEATMGLAAIHIAGGKGLPVYLYGQHYMGTLEAYLAAPLFAVFGASTELLRLPLLGLYAAFVYLMYRLTRQLYSPWLATFTVGLLAPGSDRVVREQATAQGGYPEIKVTAALLLVLAVALGQGLDRRRWLRWLAFGAFGLVAGLSVWADWLVLPYLAAAGAVLLMGCWRELLRRLGLMLGGFAVGVLPLIRDNLTAPPGQDSLSVFLALNSGSSAGAGPTSLADQVHGGVLVGVPLATGLCAPAHCARWQMWWGPLYLPLLLAAAAVAVVDLRRRGSPALGQAQAQVRAPQTGTDRRIRYAAQLALVAAGGLTVLAYARSPAAATTPLSSARYLSILQLSLPAVLWPLWRVAGWSWRALHWSAREPARDAGPAWRAGALGVLAAGVLSALAATMLVATVALVAQVRMIGDQERHERTLAAAVQRAGVRYAYGGYWTCNLLTFVTQERVICAVLGEDLHPGQDRYQAYPRQVHAAARPAFIFPVDTAPDIAFRTYVRHHDVKTTVTEAEGYRIYQPAVTIRPWS
jgi:hypothetical protein